jgi:hypothetical protein
MKIKKSLSFVTILSVALMISCTNDSPKEVTLKSIVDIAKADPANFILVDLLKKQV